MPHPTKEASLQVARFCSDVFLIGEKLLDKSLPPSIYTRLKNLIDEAESLGVDVEEKVLQFPPELRPTSHASGRFPSVIVRIPVHAKDKKSMEYHVSRLLEEKGITFHLWKKC